MHIIWTLIIGLIVGALAKLAMPGRDPGGTIVTILLGIAGSFIANYIGRATPADLQSIDGILAHSTPMQGPAPERM